MNSRKMIFKEKIVEATKSVLPVSAILLFLCFTISPIDVSNFTSFILSTAFLISGVALFSMGTDISMSKMGEFVGAQMTRSRKIWLIAILCFFVGAMVTISEPDLQILATYVPSIDRIVLILSVAGGVGIFLVIAMLRIIFGIKLKFLLIGFYALVFILASFVDKGFWTIAFDAGGVTTGPMTVPFIMALGVGVAGVRSDSKQSDDSFGLVSLCSVGPIMSVLILGLVCSSEGSSGGAFDISVATTSRDIGMGFLTSFPEYIKEVGIAVLPIVAFFLIYQAFTKPLTKANLSKILIGILYTYVGLVLFLTGANVGFMPAGYLIGEFFGNSSYSFIAVPVGMIVGYFIVAAEPAVQVLQKQVETVTSGAIPKKALAFALEIGVACSVGIAVLRAITGISILYPIVIGYSVAIILTFFVPEIFTSIAFDSGGVASGTMTATFLISFSIGLCTSVGGNIVEDAFGTVAMVAMTPLIAIQILGVVYKFRMKNVSAAMEEETLAATIELSRTLITEAITDFSSDESISDTASRAYLEIIDF